jgi:hypothetical protein
MTVWNIFRYFGILYSRLVYFVVIWYIFPVLVCLDHDKSGNPGHKTMQHPIATVYLNRKTEKKGFSKSEMKCRKNTRFRGRKKM